ncbi:MAG: hypothetical protein ACLTXH_02590 [Enterobacter hormaechei]
MTLTATYISASSFIGGLAPLIRAGLGIKAMIQLPASGSLWDTGKKFAILAPLMP